MSKPAIELPDVKQVKVTLLSEFFGVIFGMLPSSIEVFSKDFACQTGEVVA